MLSLNPPLKTIPSELNKHELSSGTILCCMIPAPPGKSIVVSFPAAGATGFEDVALAFEEASILETVVPEGVEIGGFGRAAVAAETGCFASCAFVEEFIPLEADVDVEGTDATMICSPFVIGIVET